MALQENDYAVVIGLNDYPDFRSLKGPINDAERFYKWLVSKNGGGVPTDNCIKITSEAKPGQRPTPIQDDIDYAIDSLLERIKNTPTKKARRFYFYFAGHGIGLSNQRIALCLPRWSKGFKAYALSGTDYLSVLQDRALFDEIFFFLDCCRVREIGADAQRPYLSNVETNDSALSAGKTETCFAMAAEYATKAFESGDEEVRGFFTTAILEVLQNLPPEGIGMVDFQPAVSNKTIELASQKNYVQEPRFVLNIKDLRRPIFAGTKQPPHINAGNESTEAIKGGDPSGKVETAPFELIPASTYDTEFALYDADSNLVQPKTFNRFRIDTLALGNYTLMMRRQDQVEIKQIKHTATGTSFDAPLLPLQTPVLLHGASSSHEYYTDNAVRCSTHPTSKLPPIGGAADSSFFLFARYEHQGSVPQNKPVFPKFTLLDANLNVAKEFLDTCVEKDESFGWYAFSNRARSGQYFLQVEGEATQRLISLYFYPEWQTQVFIALSNSQPVYNSIRVLMGRPDTGFVPDDRLARITDTAYKCLQDGQIPLPPGLVDDLLYGKFDNPIYGMLGAHLIVQRADKGELAGRDYKSALPIIAQNLAMLTNTPDHPDVLVVKLLADGQNNQYTFNSPPMLDATADVLIERSVTQADRVQIAHDSLFQKIAMTRVPDMPLVCWEQNIGQNVMAAGVQPESWVLNGLRFEMEQTASRGIEIDMHRLALSYKLPLATLEQAKTYLETTGSEKSSDPPSTRNMNVFVLNAKIAADQDMRKQLRVNCLEELKKAGLITDFFDREDILASQVIDRELDNMFNKADMVIELLSGDFFSDPVCQFYHDRALEAAGKKVVYVFAHPFYYKLRPELTKNSLLPTDRDSNPLAISSWSETKQAFAQITEHLVGVINV